VLTAEDDEDIRRLVAMILRRRGHTVIEAGNGAETIALAQKELPDVIVLDMLMPNGSGLEVAQALTTEERTATIPIILLSAITQPIPENTEYPPNIRRSLSKPFDPLHLIAIINEVVDSVR
jgi:CheY-like chemotaxis protein